MSDFKQQCKEIRKLSDAKPDSDWVHSNRSALLRNISTTNKRSNTFTQGLESVLRVFIPRRVYFAARGVFVMFLAFGLVTGGLVASASPLPGDIVYDVKIAVAAATGNTQAKGKLHMDKAQHQVDTLKRINVSEKPKAAEKQIKKIKKEVESAKKALSNLKEKDGEKAKDLAKEVTKKSSEIATGLKEVTEDVKAAAKEDEINEEASEDSADLVKEVIDARKVVNESGIDAIEVLAESPEEEGVKEIVEEKIGEILEDSIEISKEVEEITKDALVAESEVDVVTSSTPEVLVEGEEPLVPPTEEVSASSTVEVPEVRTVVEEQTAEAQASAVKVKEIVDQVETLLADQVKDGPSTLSEAVEKVKELNQANATASADIADVADVEKDAENQPVIVEKIVQTAPSSEEQ